MNVLLDTHVLLWWLFDDDRLSARARAHLADPGNTVFVSAASAWEIAMKHRLGRLASASILVQAIGGWVTRAGFRGLAVTLGHAQRAGTWPQSHRDPFDRMLAAQSQLEGYPLVSRDPVFVDFALSLIW